MCIYTIYITSIFNINIKYIYIYIECYTSRSVFLVMLVRDGGQNWPDMLLWNVLLFAYNCWLHANAFGCSLNDMQTTTRGWLAVTSTM